MNESTELLVEALKHPDELVRQEATQKLWQKWFHQKGVLGFEMLLKAQACMDARDTDAAERLLGEILDALPDFAEAWNRRAILYYTLGRYREAIVDCHRVIDLNPIHFGALHGLGLCQAALGNYREAILAFRRALEIQPYALVNQRLILECTARLN